MGKSMTSEQITTHLESGQLVTAYQIAVLINAKLVAEGADPIRPQMMYNYDRNGMIVPGVKNVTASQGGFTLEQVTTFVDKYVAKRLGAKVQPKPPVVDCFAVFTGNDVTKDDETVDDEPLTMIELANDDDIEA